jgi:putative peptidoglycan lipid II flippase
MLKGILSVGGFTLLSRATGFVRDVVLAAVLGAGPLNDAFLVALRLPNHFRAIFAEGAFNAAFVPAYARAREEEGEGEARAFAGRILTLLVLATGVLTALAMVFTPQVIDLLAPGFAKDPFRFDLATQLTRITFPYLVFVSVVTLLGGMLNAHKRFAAAAGAPILLNVAIIAALASAALFPSAAHAAAWGVFAAGVAELALLMLDARRAGILPAFRRPSFGGAVGRFFKALGPATIGSMGTQIALFADTIIASLLPVGALSALYFADRLQQLPIGVIGIAAGTVLLPEMSRRLAAGDEAGASAAQNRVIVIALLLAVPCVAVFLTIPDLVMRALFARGAFTSADAAAAGQTLAAYAVGLLPFVVLRAAVAPFYARRDTLTPMIAVFVGVGVNVALKVALMAPLAQVGLALGTAAGAWINVGLLLGLAARRGYLVIDRAVAVTILKVFAAGAALALALVLAEGPLRTATAALPVRDEATLAALGVVGVAVYAGLVLALLGRARLAALLGGRSRKGDGSPTPT